MSFHFCSLLHLCHGLLCCFLGFFLIYVFPCTPADSVLYQKRSRTKLMPCGRKNGNPSSRSTLDIGMPVILAAMQRRWSRKPKKIFTCCQSLFRWITITSADFTATSRGEFQSDCVSEPNIEVRRKMFGQFDEMATSSGYISNCKNEKIKTLKKKVTA